MGRWDASGGSLNRCAGGASISRGPLARNATRAGLGDERRLHKTGSKPMWPQTAVFPSTAELDRSRIGHSALSALLAAPSLS